MWHPRFPLNGIKKHMTWTKNTSVMIDVGNNSSSSDLDPRVVQWTVELQHRGRVKDSSCAEFKNSSALVVFANLIWHNDTFITRPEFSGEGNCSCSCNAQASFGESSQCLLSTTSMTFSTNLPPCSHLVTSVHRIEDYGNTNVTMVTSASRLRVTSGRITHS